MFSCEYWKISKCTCFEEHLRTAASKETLGSYCFGLSFHGQSLSKPSWLRNITKISVAFKPDPSLNLIPTLYFESMFPMFIINGYGRKANACSPKTSCFYFTCKVSIHEFHLLKQNNSSNMDNVMQNVITKWCLFCKCLLPCFQKIAFLQKDSSLLPEETKWK